MSSKVWQASVDSLVVFSLGPMKLKEPLTMELITVSSLTRAYIFPFFTTDSISEQLDFRTNKYRHFFPLLTSFVYIFSLQPLVFKPAW